MKRFFPLTFCLARLSAVLLIVLAPALEAQYVGGGRPMGKAETLDSLAASEARSSAATGDSARAALEAAKAIMPDSAAAVFDRRILFYVRLSGDSVIVDSARLVAQGNLLVKGNATVQDTLVVKGRAQLEAGADAVRSGLALISFDKGDTTWTFTSNSGTSYRTAQYDFVDVIDLLNATNATYYLKAGGLSGPNLLVVTETNSGNGTIGGNWTVTDTLILPNTTGYVRIGDFTVASGEQTMFDIRGAGTISGTNTGSAILYLLGDRGDNNDDRWYISVADGGLLSFRSKATGSWFSALELNAKRLVSVLDSLHATQANLDSLIVNSAYFFPKTAGASGKILKLDASGNLSWQEDEVASGSGGDSAVIAGMLADSVPGWIGDSLAAHPQTRPDSVLYEGQWYAEIIGWDGTPEETITLTVTAGIDSTSEDSLWTAVDRLKATGGDIYIKSGDTLWLTRGGGHLDSLPTAGGIEKEVRIWGNSKGPKAIIHGNNSTVNNYSFTFTPGRDAVGRLVFNNLLLSGPRLASASINQTYEIVLGQDGRFVFNNCEIHGDFFGYYGSLSGADSTVYFNACRMDSVCPQVTEGYMELDHCSGTLLGWHNSKIDWGNAVLVFNQCDLRVLAGVGGRSNGITRINQSRFYIDGNYTLGSSNIAVTAAGSTFYWPAANTNTYLTGSYINVTACYFERGWVQSAGALECSVTGSHFYYGTYGCVFNGTGCKAMLHGNGFNHVTTCITFPGSGATYAVATANSSVNVTSLISGMATVDSLNVDAY